MEIAEHAAQGHAEPTQSRNAQISREIVRLHARLYGRGPTKAKTYVHSEYVLCVLDEIFTPAEKTLIAAGRKELVRETRSAFQEATRDEFIGVVERNLGQRVRAFHSQIDPLSNTGIEIFVLDAPGALPEVPAEARDLPPDAS
jgi:uncharacterized protein YbcI